MCFCCCIVQSRQWSRCGCCCSHAGNWADGFCMRRWQPEPLELSSVGNEIAQPAFKAGRLPRTDRGTVSLHHHRLRALCFGFPFSDCFGNNIQTAAEEGDARVIGYGAMLLEAMVAIVSLCCVMILPATSGLLTTPIPISSMPTELELSWNRSICPKPRESRLL